MGRLNKHGEMMGTGLWLFHSIPNFIKNDGATCANKLTTECRLAAYATLGE